MNPSKAGASPPTPVGPASVAARHSVAGIRPAGLLFGAWTRSDHQARERTGRNGFRWQPRTEFDVRAKSGPSGL